MQSCSKPPEPVAGINWLVFSLIRLITSSYSTALLYHGVVRRGDGNSIDGKTFERHIALLKQNFEFISASGVGWCRRRSGWRL